MRCTANSVTSVQERRSISPSRSSACKHSHPLGHQCSASFENCHLCLHPTVPWEPGSALREPGSVPQHSMASSNPRAASSVDGEHPGCPATGPALLLTSHHRQSPQTLSPCLHPLRHLLAKSSLAPLPFFRRTWCCHLSLEHPDHARAVLLSPLARKEGRKGWQKAGHAYLLRVRVSVIPQARVGQHKPMFLPLQVHRAGGGKGKNRREIGSYQGKRRNKEGCSALRPLGLPPPPRPSQIPLVTFSWERGTR